MRIHTSREDLGFLGGHDSVSVDQLGHDTSGSLNTQSQRADVNQNKVLIAFFTRQDSTLNGRSECNSLIRVDTFRWFFAVEVLLEELLNLRNTGGSTNQDDIVNGLGLEYVTQQT